MKFIKVISRHPAPRGRVLLKLACGHTVDAIHADKEVACLECETERIKRRTKQTARIKKNIEKEPHDFD